MADSPARTTGSRAAALRHARRVIGFCTAALAVALLCLSFWAADPVAPVGIRTVVSPFEFDGPSGLEWEAEQAASAASLERRRAAAEAETSRLAAAARERPPAGASAPRATERPESRPADDELRCSDGSASVDECSGPSDDGGSSDEGSGDEGSGDDDVACDRAGDPAVEPDGRCAPYTLRVEAVAGVDAVSGTLTVECRTGFIRGVTRFGALDFSSSVAVTRTHAEPASYTVDYTMLNVDSGGMYLQTECVGAHEGAGSTGGTPPSAPPREQPGTATR